MIGVLPPTFKFAYPLDTELWTVDSWDTIEASPRGSLAFNGAVGRLKPGVPLGVAAARMAHEEHGQVTRLEPISEWVIGEIRPSVLLLGVASLILLTITCATVAGALLVRLAQRQRELAVRASLGANRLRLAREAVCEALALSVFGTTAGLLLALAVLPLFRALVPSIVPRANEIAINLWFALIAASVACVVTILSALLPALQASRIDIVQTLKRGSGTTSTDRTTVVFAVRSSSRKPRSPPPFSLRPFFWP